DIRRDAHRRLPAAGRARATANRQADRDQGHGGREGSRRKDHPQRPLLRQPGLDGTARTRPGGRDRVSQHSVSFAVEHPQTFQRSHVFLRIALLIVIGWVSHPFGLLWVGVPVVAAILVAQKGGKRYLDEDGPKVGRVLGWIVSTIAYLALLTDRLPGRDEPGMRFEVDRSVPPTVGSALLRILY